MLLITAFEPFDGTGINSSQRVLEEFLRHYAAGLAVASAVLPVEYEADVAAVQRAVRAVRPNAILHLGQSPGERPVVERIAVNLRRVGDEAGGRYQRILPDAPAAYFSPLPIEAMVAAMNAADVPAEESAHAGTFLCNHILFRSLHAAAVEGGPPAGFLHLPRLPEQAHLLGKPVPIMPLQVMVRAVKAAAEVLLRTEIR